MAIVTLLQLEFQAEAAAEGLAKLLDSLEATREFEGCLGAEVLVQRGDAALVTVIERWESVEHDIAYRAWRASIIEPNPVIALLATEPHVTYFDIADGI